MFSYYICTNYLWQCLVITSAQTICDNVWLLLLYKLSVTMFGYYLCINYLWQCLVITSAQTICVWLLLLHNVWRVKLQVWFTCLATDSSSQRLPVCRKSKSLLPVACFRYEQIGLGWNCFTCREDRRHNWVWLENVWSMTKLKGHSMLNVKWMGDSLVETVMTVKVKNNSGRNWQFFCPAENSDSFVWVVFLLDNTLPFFFCQNWNPNFWKPLQ